MPSNPELLRASLVLADRIREYSRAEQQRDKLSALGKLSWFGHELNNPASAAGRARRTSRLHARASAGHKTLDDARFHSTARFGRNFEEKLSIRWHWLRSRRPEQSDREEIGFMAEGAQNS
jgi:hypothetical protein